MACKEKFSPSAKKERGYYLSAVRKLQEVGLPNKIDGPGHEGGGMGGRRTRIVAASTVRQPGNKQDAGVGKGGAPSGYSKR